ncbi:YccF domain-containing protein [Dysgonomonas sp. 216]|uniref:YccF domain-containing protein n=1 Tax=Dysgonomonas sp. 216 TaxID=2302934 RepID=UPI0013D7A114|nr:YccF domain-containing protein [Dysgonomonas sp. 216]NDW18602.1 YccF domain-containing protein [Dysgonomonas sp. 216]
MRLLGNIIWFLFGGFMIAIEYFIASALLMITVIGIPFGLQTIKMGLLSLWPFGSRIKDNENGLGCLNLIMNIIWIIIGGFWISLTHLFWGIVLCITIVGIPFGKQHFKLIRLALFPFGKEVVAGGF